MSDATPDDDRNDSSRSNDPEATAAASDPSETEASDGDVSLKEVVTTMPETVSRDGVKRNALKLTLVFAAVGVGFLITVLAFGLLLWRLGSGDDMGLTDLDTMVQLVLALFGAVLVALLNPVVFSALIGFETANRIESAKPAVTTATVGCAVGVVTLVLVLIVGSAVGATVLVPDEAQDASDIGSDSPTSEPATVEEEDDGAGLSGAVVLLSFTGIAGGIAGGGGAYARKRYAVEPQ